VLFSLSVLSYEYTTHYVNADNDFDGKSNELRIIMSLCGHFISIVIYLELI